MQLQQMYQEIILDHYKNPHHRGLRTLMTPKFTTLIPLVARNYRSSAPRGWWRRGQSLDVVVWRPRMFDQPGLKPRYWPILLLDIRLALPWGHGLVRRTHAKSRHIEPDEDVLEDAVAFCRGCEISGKGKMSLLGWMAFKDAVARVADQGESRWPRICRAPRTVCRRWPQSRSTIDRGPRGGHAGCCRPWGSASTWSTSAWCTTFASTTTTSPRSTWPSPRRLAIDRRHRGPKPGAGTNRGPGAAWSRTTGSTGYGCHRGARKKITETAATNWGP